MAAKQTRGWLRGGLSALLLAMGGSVHAAGSFIAMGTGDVTGIYYQAGGGICSLVNAGRQDHQIRCTVASSPGSVENILALRRGEREFGFAQADLVQQAYRGNGPFSDIGGFRGLRTVFALHPETITLVAGPDADIGTVQDLRGQRVNIGPEGSGQRASMTGLMDALGWTVDDFSATSERGVSDQVDSLCEGDIDVGVFVTGHPNSAVEEALSCGGTLIPVEGPAINRLVRSADYYGATVIPGDVYEGVSSEVPTYGVTALLVSSTNTSQRIVREVTRSVFEGSNEFNDWHRAFGELTPAGMARGTQAVEAPVHPGARQLFEDDGLL